LGGRGNRMNIKNGGEYMNRKHKYKNWKWEEVIKRRGRGRRRGGVSRDCAFVISAKIPWPR